MRRFGNFQFKSWKSSGSELGVPILKAIELVATRALCDEEVLLNYRLTGRATQNIGPLGVHLQMRKRIGEDGASAGD